VLVGSIVVLLVVAYCLTYGVAVLLRHGTYHSYTYDLGLMAQVTWNSAHGRLFETSIGWHREGDTHVTANYLANHVRPILLLLALLYRLWQDPRLLLVLQTLALGLGAVLLDRVVTHLTDAPHLRLLVVGGYLASPALGFVNMFDFHPITLSIPLVFLLYLSLLKERPVLFWTAVGLMLTLKEEVVIPLAMCAGYIWFLHPASTGEGRRRQRRWALVLAGVAVLWAALSFAVVMPYFSGGRGYRFAGWWRHLLHPQRLSTSSTANGSTWADRARFVGHVLLPAGGLLPLLGPVMLVTLPSWAYLLVSGNPQHHALGNHYAAVVIPWIALAQAQALHLVARAVRERVPWVRTVAHVVLAAVCLGGLGLAYRVSDGGPIARYQRAGLLSPRPLDTEIEGALARIPPDAGVATINAFGAQLANRRILIDIDRYYFTRDLLRDRLQVVDYVLLDLTDCRAVFEADERQRADVTAQEAYGAIVETVLDTGAFGVAYWPDRGRIILLQRGAPSASEPVRDYLQAARSRPCYTDLD
jgi:uncharacterized membrane protein